MRFHRGELCNREQFGEFLNRLGLTGQAIEVGTHLGCFAESLLETWKGQRLLCIDAYWLPLPDEYYKSEEGWIPRERHADYQAAIGRMERFGDRVQIIVARSVEAAAAIPDGAAQFIYIDASHLRADIEVDLDTYWPKLAVGGIYAGHDISGRWEPEVKPAVEQFALAHGIETVYTVPGSDRTCWGILDSWYLHKDRP